MRINVSPSLESGGKTAMELGLKIIIFICFTTSTTTPSSQTTILSSQTTTPTSPSIIIYISSPTIFPTNSTCFTPRAPIMALIGPPATTTITPTKFYVAPAMIPPEIHIIYGINLLLVTVLLFAAIPTVVLIPPPECTTPPRGVQDICQ